MFHKKEYTFEVLMYISPIKLYLGITSKSSFAASDKLQIEESCSSKKLFFSSDSSPDYMSFYFIILVLKRLWFWQNYLKGLSYIYKII